MEIEVVAKEKLQVIWKAAKPGDIAVVARILP